MKYIFNAYGEKRSLEDIQAATRLIKLKEQHGGNVWPVVEECIKIWISKNPRQYQSFLVNLEDMKKSRRNKFASSETEMYRYTLDVPEQVIFMLRKLYSTSELPMDKKFFRTWARKFPKMQIAEKI